MKRTPLKRGKPLKRTGFLKRSTTPIRKSNPEAKKKREKRYKAALSSPHAKAQKKRILERSGGICECGCGQPFTPEDPFQRAHLTYARMGNELDTDVGAWRRSCNLRERASRSYRGKIR